jgi:hypothetical protein
MQNAPLDWTIKIAAVCIAAMSAMNAASARNVVVDASLNPSLMQFNLEVPSGSTCDNTLCTVLLPYSVDIGGGFTNKMFLYQSGIVSAGKPLPAGAFSSNPVDSGGNPVSVEQYFASSGHHILAAGYRPDDAGTPGSLSFGQVGLTTSNTTHVFAVNSIGFCTVQAPPATINAGDKTTCPAGFDPSAGIDPTPSDISNFITLNKLDRFEGDINLKVGLEYVVFHKPASGFVNVEFFQNDNFQQETDPVYVGLANNLQLFDIFDAEGTTFSYRFPINTAVPEPASWAMMIAGFGIAGAAARRRSRARVPQPA